MYIFIGCNIKEYARTIVQGSHAVMRTRKELSPTRRERGTWQGMGKKIETNTLFRLRV